MQSARCAKNVEWSEEDHCYLGSFPGLLFGGCYGTDEKMVFGELCQVVEEMIASLSQRRDTASTIDI